MTRPALSPLPIDAVLPGLLTALRTGNAVLVAPTGAGKTTRVPPALLAAGLAGEGQVVVLEPRRVAARAAALRMAEEAGLRLGDEIGYQVRFDRRAGPATRILVVTEGILLQRLQGDPFLEGVGAVVFDELHERGLAADLALAMTRRVQRDARPDLRLLAMSATLDPGPIAAFLGGCPVVESRGRLHPVAIRHFDPESRLAGRQDDRPLPGKILAAVRQALAESPGGVLVFLPGTGEIRRAAEALAPLAAELNLHLLPLHGDLPPDQQDEALRPSPRRKVVLATNVAETSVTVAGITAVVDTGLVRRQGYDPATGLDRLELGKVSRAAADQRAGRAGRESPGLCLRLWPAWEHPTLPERETPEIARVDLAGAALQLLAWGEPDLTTFDWLQPPTPEALAAATTLLHRLGATDDRGTTPLGHQMARLPLHPRLARLLLAGHAQGITQDTALLAALLSERDPFRATPERPRAPGHASRSDLLDRLDALEAQSPSRGASRFAESPRGAARFDNGAQGPGLLPAATGATPVARRSGGEHTQALSGPISTPGASRFVASPGATRFVLATRDQLAAATYRELGPDPPRAVDRDDALLRSLLAAYPDRLARRREPKSPRALMVGGRGVRLAAESAVIEPELFLCLQIDDARRDATGESLVRLASEVDPAWLPPDRLRTEVEIEWDDSKERVIAWKRTRYEDLTIAEAEASLPDGGPLREEAERRLIAEAAGRSDRPDRLHRALPLDDPEVASFLARARCLAAWRPELDLPPFDDDALAGLLPALAAGRRSFADLRRAPLLAALEGTLTHAQLKALRREAPERLPVPSGSQVRLLYEPGRPPILAARIQELFGLAETPRIAAGRVPVLLHLLAPNGRPQQVTHDLQSFWENTYPQVRKELQGRYPKHAWPQDPKTASPERRPGRSG